MSFLIGVYGASGFGREVMPVLHAQLGDKGETRCVFIDDAGSKTSVNGHNCMTFEAFCAQPAENRAITIAIGSGTVRETLLRKMHRRWYFLLRRERPKTQSLWTA